MHIFEYPFVIITVLVFVFILMGAIGIIFAIKGIKTAKGIIGKDFVSTYKLEGEFKKLTEKKSNRCVIYIEISLDTMNRVYSSTKANSILYNLEDILRNIFFCRQYLCMPY